MSASLGRTLYMRHNVGSDQSGTREMCALTNAQWRRGLGQISRDWSICAKTACVIHGYVRGSMEQRAREERTGSPEGKQTTQLA